MNLRYLLFYVIFIHSLNLFAQKSKNLSYRAEAFASISTGEYTPFWIVNHTWGMVPLNANNGYLRGGIFYDQQLNKDWSYSLGLDIAVSTPHVYKNNAWVQQLYAEVNWKSLRVNIGSKEDYISFMDEKLSSGDMCYSRNTRPAPKIRGSIPSFIAIPWTKEYLYFKGNISIGLYMDGDYHEKIAKPYREDYMKNTLSHSKSLYFRIGNIETKEPVQFIFGIDHRAQWGGDLYRDGQIFRMANGNYWSHFKNVFIGKQGGEGSIMTDRLYAVGSSVGNFLLRFDYQAKNKSVWSIYLNHYFEDGSGIGWKNYPDMLLGIQYKSQKKSLCSGALIEYLYMRHQSGPIHFNISMDESHYHLSKYGYGMDNYYNNGDYPHGQSYFGRTRGNPLFLAPEYNKDGFLGFMSNRILAWHGGIEGYFSPNIEYRALLTYAETLGRYDIPYTELRKGISGVFDLTYHVPHVNGLDLKFSIGSSLGEYFNDDNFGFACTITKRGLLLP